MGRWLRRGALALAALAVVLAAPVVWIESACAVRRSPGVRAPAPLVNDPGYVRRTSDGYLSFPEWHIVYAYDDLAAVLEQRDPSAFAHTRQVAGFWRSLCGLTRLATARSPVGADMRVMLYTIGWSFTVELAVKGAYENTVGRTFEWLRGPERTAEDAFVARDMRAYAGFLRQTPWYEYPFAARLAAFWRETPLGGPGMARKLERRVAVTLEYGVKAVYGAAIGWASATALGAADLEIHTVVAGLEPADAARDPRIRIVRALGDGRTLIRTPRYQAYTDVLVDLARRGHDVVEIAGNRRILVTVLAPRGSAPAPPGSAVIFQMPIQSRPDRQRVGLDVAVDRLAEAIRALERAGVAIEHVYE